MAQAHVFTVHHVSPALAIAPRRSHRAGGARPRLRLFSETAPPPPVARPLLGAAICVAFCGAFWSALALAVVGS